MCLPVTVDPTAWTVDINLLYVCVEASGGALKNELPFRVNVGFDFNEFASY